MSTFIVTACGHSGTKLLATQLKMAPGWTVAHEPDDHILSWFIERRFVNKDRYGEVNSFLLTSARRIVVDVKAVLLRNPYDLVTSVAKTKPIDYAINYVREAISILDNLIVCEKFNIIRFDGIISNKEYVLRTAQMLGIDNLPAETVRVRTRINRHGPEPVIPPMSSVTRDEFDHFIYTYDL